jgi:hypothetical protein
VPTAYKVLGQVCPATTAATPLYTVASTTQVVVSSIAVANLATASRTYRVAVRPNGATLASLHYLAYDVTVAANDSTVITLGATLDTADVVDVRASAANDLAFTIFGAELT